MRPLSDDPASFADDMLEGFVDLYPAYVRRVPGGVVRATPTAPGKIAVVVGGGSGHYPAFCGLVGPGLADGAVVGNVFTSPSTADAVSVGRESAGDSGVVLITGNYAGDVMNFTLAEQQLTASGIPARFLVVTDDIASAPPGEEQLRRGIAGDLTVFKVAASAAEHGHDLAGVVELAERANARTRTLGVAFDGCTMPGTSEPLFRVAEGTVGLGVGIHGEPGIGELPLMTASELGALFVERLLQEAPADAGRRVTALLNGLGRTKYEELFVLWRSVRRALDEAGLEVVAPEAGELVTSLDMAGCSLTLMWLDEELEQHWVAPVDTPALRRGSVPVGAGTTSAQAGAVAGSRAAGDGAPGTTAPGTSAPGTTSADLAAPGDVSAEDRALARTVVAGLRSALAAVTDAEARLAELDAVAGDGDHGRGMVRGLSAALQAAEAADATGHGGRATLEAAGHAWADKAGGTSGMLWGSALVAAAAEIGPSADDVVRALRAGTDTVATLGRAAEGDKTMLDAALPFVRSLADAVGGGTDLAAAWPEAARTARDAAEATSALRPRVGRARPLAERSIGSPDPGAISFALVVAALAGTAPGEES